MYISKSDESNFRTYPGPPNLFFYSSTGPVLTSGIEKFKISNGFYSELEPHIVLPFQVHLDLYLLAF
jgi:hypothetical protein